MTSYPVRSHDLETGSPWLDLSLSWTHLGTLGKLQPLLQSLICNMGILILICFTERLKGLQDNECEVLWTLQALYNGRYYHYNLTMMTGTDREGTKLVISKGNQGITSHEVNLLKFWVLDRSQDKQHDRELQLARLLCEGGQSAKDREAGHLLTLPHCVLTYT